MAIKLFIGSSIESAVMEASRYGITGSEAGVSRADKVLEIVADRTYGLIDMDNVDMETLVYESFADIGKPEPFTDQDGNLVYNAGEPFVDINGNGQWDADMGAAGLGGPSDVVVYRLTYAWGIITPVVQRADGRECHPRLERRRPQRAVLRRTAMHRLLARLWRDDRGFSAAEFGLLLPILLMFSAGTIEYSRLILLTQKLQSSSFILADLTARDKTLSEEQLENIFLAIDNIVQPFEFADEGKAIVSSVGVDSSDQTVINWQRSGSGALTATSELGSEGGTADLPDDLDIREGETIIAAEVFFNFEPIFGIGLAPRVLHKVAFYKPRLGTLDTLEP